MATPYGSPNFQWTTKSFTCFEVTKEGSEIPVTSPLEPNETLQIEVQEPCLFSTTAAAPAKLLHKTRITDEPRLSLPSMLKQGDEGKVHPIPDEPFYIWVPYNHSNMPGGLTRLEFPDFTINVLRVKSEGHGLSSTTILKTVTLKMGGVTTTGKVQAQVERDYLGELNLVQSTATRREPFKAKSFDSLNPNGSAITNLFKEQKPSCFTACLSGG